MNRQDFPLVLLPRSAAHDRGSRIFWQRPRSQGVRSRSAIWGARSPRSPAGGPRHWCTLRKAFPDARVLRDQCGHWRHGLRSRGLSAEARRAWTRSRISCLWSSRSTTAARHRSRSPAAWRGLSARPGSALPSCDICFVYTVTESLVPPLLEGKFPRAASVMEAVAEHYGIPSIHLGARSCSAGQGGEAALESAAAKRKERRRAARLCQ